MTTQEKAVLAALAMKNPPEGFLMSSVMVVPHSAEVVNLQIVYTYVGGPRPSIWIHADLTATGYEVPMSTGRLWSQETALARKLKLVLEFLYDPHHAYWRGEAYSDVMSAWRTTVIPYMKEKSSEHSTQS